MVKVYAWPPVGVLARNWTMELPTSRSRSIITGQEYVSAAQRRRRVATLDVVGRRHYGSGYMEALWRFMDGGVHLVRLASCRIPWGMVDISDDDRGGGGPLGWSIPPEDLGWIEPIDEIIWVTGAVLPSTYSLIEGVPTLTVTGLPPNALVAIPGEFLTIFADDGAQETIMIANPVHSNASGTVVIRLTNVPTISGSVSIGTREVGVFRLASNWPRPKRGGGLQENYTLDFREVFEDETNGFVEVNPWI